MKNSDKKNFWQKLQEAAIGRSAGGGQAILALAPMAGISDSAFRQLVRSYGADVVYSEMASAAALFFQPKKTLRLLEFDKKERPYIVQLFGNEPRHFKKAVEIIEKKIKPDGIDLNFGCPVKKIAKQGAGAVLMDRPKEARRIIETVIRSTDLPVSIKIRTRSGQTDALSFLDAINDLPLSAVMIHGRTMSQGHSGAVDWQTIKAARRHFDGVLLANGGANDYKSAENLLSRSGADGIGIARGALGKPWIFEDIRMKKDKERSRSEIFSVALNHAILLYRLKGRAGLIEMRKHLCWYVAGQPDAGLLRSELVHVSTLAEIKSILR